VELWRYYRILRRRRWLIVITMAICMGLVGFYSVFLTPELWTGRTRVMERRPAEMGVPVYGEQYMVQPNTEMHLADLAYIATSNNVINRSIDALRDLNVTLDPLDLIRTLRVEPVANTQILSIEVTSRDQVEAKAAADVVSAEFQRFYRELVSSAAEQSREFIEKQLKDAQARLAEAREKRRDFKAANELVELNIQEQTMIQRTAQIETDSIGAGIVQSDLGNRLRSINAQMAAEPEMQMSAETTTTNPIYQDLLARKVAAETQLQTMLLTRGPNHPEVKTLKRGLDEVNAQIKAQIPKIVSAETKTQNQVFVSALQARLSLNADAAGTAARRTALLAALETERSKLTKLPEQEMQMAQRELDVTASEETYRLLRAKLDEARIKAHETNSASAIQVIDSAYVYPVDPKTPLKLALALVLSPLLGAALVFLLNYLDNTVKTPAEAEDLLGLPVLTVVPLARSHALARRPDNQPLIATYEMLAATLWRTVAKSASPTVLVASAEADTGRSTTAANLAIALARDGARVILVDADMRRPSQHLMFGVQRNPGLSNVLSGGVALEDALVPTKVEGLLLLTAGPTPDNPVRLLRSQQMGEIVAQAGSLGEFVVFDSPAGVTFADASLLASYVKNVVIVHAAGKAPRGAESEFRNKLDVVGANIVGAVLNRVHPEDSHAYFQYRRFYEDLTVEDSGRAAVPGGVRAIPPGGNGPGESGGNKQ